MEKEPAAVIAVINGIVQGGIALLVAFGIPIGPDQQIAIMAFAAQLGIAVQWILTRAHVFSPATHNRELGEQKAEYEGLFTSDGHGGPDA